VLGSPATEAGPMRAHAPVSMMLIAIANVIVSLCMSVPPS
jgi:hypothetical protein